MNSKQQTSNGGTFWINFLLGFSLTFKKLYTIQQPFSIDLSLCKRKHYSDHRRTMWSFLDSMKPVIQ